MKTNQKLSIVSLLALGVLAAGLSAKPASGRELEGKFTLPSATRWGMATLPAGDYSFTLEQPNGDGVITVYRGERAVALVVLQSRGEAKSDRAKMVLVGGVVRELNLPQIGATLSFSDHNPRPHAPKETELAQTIPVTVVGAAGR